MKIVYVAHPVGGNVSENLERIKRIVREINLTEPDTIPFVNYFADCHALDDNVPEERERGLKNNSEFFKRKCIDELRLYGGKISAGMKSEVLYCLEYKIPVVPMCANTEREYNQILVNNLVL